MINPKFFYIYSLVVAHVNTCTSNDSSLPKCPDRATRLNWESLNSPNCCYGMPVPPFSNRFWKLPWEMKFLDQYVPIPTTYFSKIFSSAIQIWAELEIMASVERKNVNFIDVKVEWKMICTSIVRWLQPEIYSNQKFPKNHINS